MDNAFQEALYQLLMLVLTVSITVITAYLKRYLQTNIDVTKFGYTNEEVDNIISKAVIYAEQKGKEYIKNSVKENDKKLSGNDKYNYAVKYINKIDPSIIEKYGDKLSMLITAKVGEKFNIK